MNIIREYTLDHIRKNRRSSISISIAILISATLLCSLCIFVHSLWAWEIDSMIAQGGEWHGELYDTTRGDELALVEGNPNVKLTMIKGEWEAALLPKGSNLPYLLFRDTDQNYWDNMGEKNSIMEGHIPQKTGEIAVSKSFFDRNPDFHIGDTFTLPVGARMLDSEILEVQSIRREGETFAATGERTFTVVGKMDMTTSTVNPGYYAMGFLDRANIAPDDGLTVYLQMKDMCKTYEVMPQIAQSLGWEKDEYGDYSLRYNKLFLIFNGIAPPDQLFYMETIAKPLLFIILAVIAVGAFVMIIHSAFALSADARVKQLGMFRSVGATPKQIRSSILFEGLVLSVLPITIGIGLGYLFSNYAARLYTDSLGDYMDYPLTITFSWWVVLGAIVLSLITVLLSAGVPARRMAKLTPIEAIRQTESATRLKKPKRHHLLSHLLGFSGELAADSFRAHKRGFRACISALVMCLVLVNGLICVMAISNMIFDRDEKECYYDMNAFFDWTGEAEEALLSQMRALPEVTESITTTESRCALWVSTENEAPEFSAIGGLAGIDPNQYDVIERDGKYRIIATLVGMDDNAFADYLAALGQNPADFYGGKAPKAIAVNSVPKDINARQEALAKEEIPFLNLAFGDELLLSENQSDDIKSDYTFSVEIPFVARQRPITDINYSHYGILLFMPMQTYYSIVENFLPERAAINYRTDIKMLVGDENSPKVQAKLEELSSSVMAEEDYLVYSKLSERAEKDTSNSALQAVFNSIAILLGLIGIFNALTSIATSLRLRRREFAMLRSVGLDSVGIGRILLLEGLYFAVMPVLASIPFLFAICALFLYMMNFSWMQFLPVLPWEQLLFSSLVIMAAVGLSYWLSARKLRQDSIIDAIKDETI